MVKSFLLFFIISFSLQAESLYTDDVNQVIAKPTSTPQPMDYNYSSQGDSLEPSLTEALDKYVNNIFRLSQLTPDLSMITNESLVFSDIKRLEQISIQLMTLLDKKDINITYSSSPSVSKLQATFQKSTFKFYALSPYIPYLLTYHKEKTIYYINYISTITSQLTTTINERVAANKQLNLGKSSTLPFSPQTPQQLSFALENQMTQSMIGLMGPSTQTTGEMMPFANISTPANTDLFNQTNGSPGSPTNMVNQVSTPNGMPLQMMNYMPSF